MRIFLTVWFFMLFLCPVWAQQIPDKKPPSSSGPADRKPPLIPSNGHRDVFTRPVFVSGKVVLEDGAEAKDLLRVQLLCNGALVRQVFCETGGHFSIQVNSTGPQEIMDAGMSGRQTDPLASGGSFAGAGSRGGPDSIDRINLTGCELRGSLTGFRSDTVHLGTRRVLDSPNIGTIVLHRLAGVEGSTISLNTLSAPKKALKRFREAREELDKKKPDFRKAARKFEEATQEYADFSAAWYLLGEVLSVLDQHDEARGAFREAMRTDGRFVSPVLALARLEAGEANWSRAAELSAQVQSLNPYIIEGLYLGAVAAFYMDDFREAEALVRRVLQSTEAEQFPGSFYIMGVLLAQQGQIGLATANFQRFLLLSPDDPAAGPVRAQIESWAAAGYPTEAALSGTKPR